MNLKKKIVSTSCCTSIGISRMEVLNGANGGTDFDLAFSLIEAVPVDVGGDDVGVEIDGVGDNGLSTIQINGLNGFDVFLLFNGCGVFGISTIGLGVRCGTKSD